MKGVWILLLLALVSADVRAKPLVKSKAITSDVRLPTEIVAFAERNRALFEDATRSEEAFCEFVADSLSLLKPLEEAVANTTPPPSNDESDDDSGEYGAETAGASVYVVEGGIHVSLHWKNLLSVAPLTSRPLVRAIETLGLDSFGAWIDQMTDWGGCHRPELALAPLKSLSAAWQTAPACLRDVFRPKLVEALSSMTENGCFCDGEAKRAELQRHLEDNARVLGQMAGLGARYARRLRRLAARPDAIFGCTGPH